MAALNFPASPTNGQTYTANGKTFVWNGTQWVPVIVDLAYTGTLTGGTGIINIGSGQIYKDASGNVGIGTSSPSCLLDIRGNNEYVDNYSSGTASLFLSGPANEYTTLQVTSWGGAATGGTATPYSQALCRLKRVRGTVSSPLTTQDGDYIGSYCFDSVTTTGLQRSTARIDSYQTGNSTTTGVPGCLVFLTNDGVNDDPIERLRITPSGKAGIGTDAPSDLLDVNSNQIRLRSAKTPASATATGSAGQICWDSSYIYVCTATNTWKRAALSTW